MSDNEPWKDYEHLRPKAKPPAFIPGTPKPVSPVEQTRLDLSVQQEQRQQANDAYQRQQDAERAARDAAADARAAEKHAADMAKTQAELDVAEEKRRKSSGWEARQAQELGSVIRAARKARTMSRDRFFATGFGADTAGSINGTAARDVQGLLDTIAANTAFKELQEMRENSPTGGALGSIAVRELELLGSTIASLDKGVSDEQFAENMQAIEDSYLEVYKKLGGNDPEILGVGAKGTGTAKQDDQNLPGLTGVVTDDSPIDPNDPNGGGRAPNSVVGGLEAGAGDVVEFLGETLGLVANPLNSGINALTGSNLTTDMGQTFREASGLRRGGAMAEAVNKGGLAAMTGTGIARGVGSLAGQYGMPVAEAVAGRVAATPGRDFAAGMSAGAGGQLAQDAGFGLGGQIIGGLAGGLGGYRAANRLANAGRSQPNALAMAAQRQGVDLMPADAGGTITKRMSAGAVQMPIASGQMVRGAERSQTQMREATSRIAASQGDAAATDIAGQSLATAAKGYISRTSARASNLYDKAEQASKGVRIKPTQTTAVIDDQIARLRELPDTNASFIKELEKLKNDIKGGVKISGLRDARSALSSGTFDGKLRSGREKAVYKQIVTALSDDMTAGLQSVGRKDAAMMFAKADKFWQQRVQHIDEVLEPIVGKKKGGEEVIASIEAMARGTSGGNKRLSRLLGELNPKEAGNVRAVVIDRIGRATAGAQDDTGSKFSAATFLTNWNKMTPQAKSSLFGSSELRANLDDIAKLASAMKTTGRFANTSQTAGAINAAALGTAAYAHPILGITMAGGQYATGKLLSSPAFARWLAKSPKTQNPQALKTYVERLELVASREPLIAADARQLQQQLIEAISPTRLAADEKKNEAGGKPPAQ